ncbi:putative RNA-directed DNA polymerase from transposon X-element [Trichonephila clavipes]|nr:putative RNA-directed DNA polymerase from transposon X-element [Trichonephila clavipes]
MFLVENRNLDVPDIDYRDIVNLRKRVRYRQKLLNDLRHRFRKEYLGLLIKNKNKKGPLSELRLGEIVFIGRQNQNCGTKDSNWNNVTTHSKSLSFGSAVDRNLDDPLNDCTFTNPISRDMLSDPSDSSSVLARVSRHGRVIKVPDKLDFFNQALYVFESK